jgi:hypothetical protein
MFVRDGRDDGRVTEHLYMQVAERRDMDVDDRTDRIEDPRMAELKDRIAAGYEVDAEQVAREIVRKLRLVKWARQELVSSAGRTPARSDRGL